MPLPAQLRRGSFKLADLLEALAEQPREVMLSYFWSSLKVYDSNITEVQLLKARLFDEVTDEDADETKRAEIAQWLNAQEEEFTALQTEMRRAIFYLTESYANYNTRSRAIATYRKMQELNGTRMFEIRKYTSAVNYLRNLLETLANGEAELLEVVMRLGRLKLTAENNDGNGDFLTTIEKQRENTCRAGLLKVRERFVKIISITGPQLYEMPISDNTSLMVADVLYNNCYMETRCNLSPLLKNGSDSHEFQGTDEQLFENIAEIKCFCERALPLIERRWIEIRCKSYGGHPEFYSDLP